MPPEKSVLFIQSKIKEHVGEVAEVELPLYVVPEELAKMRDNLRGLLESSLQGGDHYGERIYRTSLKTLLELEGRLLSRLKFGSAEADDGKDAIAKAVAAERERCALACEAVIGDVTWSPRAQEVVRSALRAAAGRI